MGLLSTIGSASGRAFGFTRSAIAAAVDQYFNLTTLLLPGNGTNGAQNNTFLDSSTNNFTITRNGNTTQGTFSPFSQTGWSNYFASSSGFRFADSADFSMGTNAFTIECFVYLTKTQSAGSGFISQWVDANDSNSSWQLGVDWSGGAGGNKFAGQISIGGTVTAINDTTNYALNTWHHVVLCRSGSPGTTALFVNGVRVASSTVTGAIVDATNPVGIGVRGGSDSYYQDGVYISNVRVVNGTDVYGATNTTLTVPTSPLTAVTNTKLLTCQSNRFLDTNTQVTAKAVSQVLGTPSVQSFSPFAPTAAYSAATNGGSGYFDGAGDYLNSSIATVGTGNFTIEGWVYITAHSGGAGEWGVFQTSTTAGGFNGVYTTGVTLIRTGGVFKLFILNSSITSTYTIPLNTWIHFAVVRNSGTVTLYVNGTSSGTPVTETGNLAANYIAVGGYVSTTYLMTGYVSGFRAVNSAVYTANFTPPTAPPTAITNTQYLLNFTNAGITDATAKNVLETVGNAQISTTQSKFGGGSMYFDGTGDYLQLPSSQNLAFGTGPYTVEMWMNVSNLSALRGLFVMGNFRFFQNTVGFWFLNGGSSIINLGSGASANTWQHIALVRTGTGTNQTTLYVNGTSIGTGTDSQDWPAAIAYIGSEAAANYFLGYLDDFRITKGYARYTGNFTPPTAAFALQ